MPSLFGGTRLFFVAVPAFFVAVSAFVSAFFTGTGFLCCCSSTVFFWWHVESERLQLEVGFFVLCVSDKLSSHDELDFSCSTQEKEGRPRKMGAFFW